MRSKAKQRAAYKRHYQKHGDRVRARVAIRNAKKRKEAQEFVAREKDKPCTDCNKRFPSCVMDFDHVKDKKYLVSRIMWGGEIKKIKAEIAKCELVCANCHRIRTYNRLKKFATSTWIRKAALLENGYEISAGL